MIQKVYPSQDHLQRYYTYFEGKLIRKTNMGKWYAGTAIGGINAKGRWNANVHKFSGLYYVSVLVWIYHNGDVPLGLEVDHKNRNKADDRIENLELKTPSGNSINRKSSDRELPPGVTIGRGDNFVATFRGKYLGHSTDLEVARQLYLQAQRAYYESDI